MKLLIFAFSLIALFIAIIVVIVCGAFCVTLYSNILIRSRMKNIKIGTLLKLNMSNHIGIIVSVENLFIVRDNNPQIVIVWGDKSRTIETVAGFDNMKRAGCYIVVC